MPQNVTFRFGDEERYWPVDYLPREGETVSVSNMPAGAGELRVARVEHFIGGAYRGHRVIVHLERPVP